MLIMLKCYAKAELKQKQFDHISIAYHLSAFCIHLLHPSHSLETLFYIKLLNDGQNLSYFNITNILCL